MNDSRITIDIVCPYGGSKGGVEDVIYSWVQNLNNDLFEIRVMHMTPGTAYLHGYEKAYFLKNEIDYVDANYCASGYNLFLENLGAPDICIACNEPFATSACRAVLNYSKIDVPLFSWVHTDISRYAISGNGNTYDLLQADYHLAINSQIKNEILSNDPKAVVYVIGNPILHEIPSDISIGDTNTLVYVGRLAMEKRLDLIIEAIFKAHSFWKLDIIGDGKLMDECKKWIKTLRLGHQVNLLGWKDNPLMYMKDATAVVSASDYEGFSLSCIEALAMGKMLISTPVEGIKEYLKEGENGYFFDFDDADGLAQILDDIASGKKSIASPDICRESVRAYQKENYFATIRQILIDAYKKKTPA